MDLEEYWQENKGFVGVVAAGLVAFLAAVFAVSNYYEDDIDSLTRRRAKVSGKLSAALFGRSDMDEAEGENQELGEALEALRESVEFAPRAGFVLDDARGAPSSQYLRVSTAVREDIVSLANRSGMTLVPGLGLPELSPTREAEIVRYLEAVDVIDRVLRLAIDAGVKKADSIRIKLDPATYQRGEIRRVERTTVSFQLSGPSRPLLRLVEETQRPREGKPLAVGEVQLKPSSRQIDEAGLDLVVVIPRLRPRVEEAGE